MAIGLSAMRIRSHCEWWPDSCSIWRYLLANMSIQKCDIIRILQEVILRCRIHEERNRITNNVKIISLGRHLNAAVPDDICCHAKSCTTDAVQYAMRLMEDLRYCITTCQLFFPANATQYLHDACLKQRRSPSGDKCPLT